MTKNRNKTKFPFIPDYKTLREILTSHELAALGDAYVNFIYSLALTKQKRKPTGSKVKSHILAEALKKAGLRKFLPSRMTRHTLADAAEALLAYAWIKNAITINESIHVLEQTKDKKEAFSSLLLLAKKKLKL